jgi:hypothetical protein
VGGECRRRHRILPGVWEQTAITHCPPRALLLLSVELNTLLACPCTLTRQVLVANPRQNRFELYASCAAFSLFQEPFRAALQPAASEWLTGIASWQQLGGRAAWAARA